jgi:hypothetical protein
MCASHCASTAHRLYAYVISGVHFRCALRRVLLWLQRGVSGVSAVLVAAADQTSVRVLYDAEALLRPLHSYAVSQSAAVSHADR